MKNEILRLEHIYLLRNGITILEDFKLNIFEGEFVLLYGNFGSGRKELAEFLAGKMEVTSGSVYINEEKLNAKEPLISARMGVFVISDNTGLVPCLTVAENIFLSWKKNIFSFTLPKKMLNNQTERILNMLGIDTIPNKLVSEISCIDQQMVKLAKAYCRNVKLIVMNDIADIYTPTERNRLFAALKFLQEKGVAILWITGKCMNAMEYMDKMVVIRHGRNVRTFFDTPEDKESLSRLVNETIHTRVASWTTEQKMQEIFRMQIKEDQLGIPIVIHKSECVGVVFEDSKELEEFSNRILGKQCSNNISMWLNGMPYSTSSYQKAIEKGLYEIDMIDIQNNLFHNLSVKENLVIHSMKRTSRGKLFINKRFMEFVHAKFREKHKLQNKNMIEDCSWKDREDIIFHRLSINNSKLIVATEFWAHVDDARWDGMMDNIQYILQQNKSFLFLSVNGSDLKPVCNRVYFLRDGKIELYVK